MKIHILQHVPFEGAGSMVTWASHNGHPLSSTRLFAGDPFPALEAFDLLVIMGGPMSVHDEGQFPWMVEEKRFVETALKKQKGIIGICLGAQIIANLLGARVFPNAHKEIGWFPVRREAGSSAFPLLDGLPDEMMAFHWHGETFDLPSGAVHAASSTVCANQAFGYGRNVVGLQFHLESTPASVAALVEHCPEDLVPAPFVQQAQEMLVDAQRFTRINQVMADLLTRIEQKSR